MLSVVVLDTLHEDVTSVSALLSAACNLRELPIKRLKVVHELTPLLEGDGDLIEAYNVFIASFAEPREEYIEFTQGIRRRRENLFIVFVTGRQADISSFVRPSVRPSGILFIPLERERVYQTIKEIYLEHLRESGRGEQPVFTIKSGGEYFSLNTGEILFFEAQGKKIAAKTKGQEISFYSNFESVLEQLPEWFIRCHKGFVVNTKHIVQASFTDMILILRDKSAIPISRTYRDEVRALLEPRGV